MNVDSDALTGPILDRAQAAALRAQGRHRIQEQQPAAAPPAGPWLLLVILGVGIVVAMLVLVVVLS